VSRRRIAWLVCTLVLAAPLALADPALLVLLSDPALLVLLSDPALFFAAACVALGLVRARYPRLRGRQARALWRRGRSRRAE
jgi:hypothetical protein